MSQKKSLGKLRIIAGKWRGRKIAIPLIEGLRPTPDRIRETLFNWLAPTISESRCLDLFAGSGALSFEALSRGALSAILIDSNKQVADHLQTTLQQLQISNASLYCADAFQISLPKDTVINTVFLDPPFNKDLLEKCGKWLTQQPWLEKNAKIYIESELPLDRLSLPEAWRLLQNKSAGKVYYYLFETT